MWSQKLAAGLLVYLQSVLFLLLNFETGLVSAQVMGPGVCPTTLGPMKHVDLDQYFGRWYEIERSFFLPEVGTSCLAVDYFSRGSNDFWGVQITYFRAGNMPVLLGGTTKVNKNGTGDLTLNLLITEITPYPFHNHRPYYLIRTDYKTYAIKWDCKQITPTTNSQMLWVMGREREFSDKTRNEIYSYLKSVGLRPEILRRSNQRHCSGKHVI